MSNQVTPSDLIAAGIPGGPYFKPLLDAANGNDNLNHAQRIAHAKEVYSSQYEIKKQPLQNGVKLGVNIEAENAAEQANMDASIASMDLAAKTPTVRGAAIMPDACPSGPAGHITVGGVIATENAIHPGMHSADVCCSMMATNLGQVDPAEVMGAAFGNVRFGPFAKKSPDRIKPDTSLLDKFRGNRFMRDEKILFNAESQIGTQGDGNHFYFIGTSEKTGDTYIVSHHGSRGVGSRLYSLGMKEAIAHTRKHSPDTLKANSWIEADSDIGEDYWEALQLARAWTKLNHASVHDLIAKQLGVNYVDRWWNEHNFVFNRNGLFYHAKGATPAWDGFSQDADEQGRTIIPLNMAQPVLIVKGSDNPNALGFSPHGAGRNMSRTAHKATLGDRSIDEVFHEETKNIDARFQAGKIDTSELPSAYKNAESVASQIERMKLADVVDRIMPHGSIMAGDIDLPWKRKKENQECS